MAVRATMAALIAEVRLLTNDPATPSPVFTDQQYQDELDHTRDDIAYLILASRPTIASGGTTTWLDYYAMISDTVGLGDWESDATLQGNSFQALTPATSDYLIGHWTFAANTLPPVYLVGKTYDRYYAAATILQKWAATKVQAMKFSTDRQSFNPGEIRTNLLDLAKHYLGQARVGRLQMTRTDRPGGLGAVRAFDMSQTRF